MMNISNKMSLSDRWQPQITWKAFVETLQSANKLLFYNLQLESTQKQWIIKTANILFFDIHIKIQISAFFKTLSPCKKKIPACFYTTEMYTTTQSQHSCQKKQRRAPLNTSFNKALLFDLLKKNRINERQNILYPLKK